MCMACGGVCVGGGAGGYVLCGKYVNPIAKDLTVPTYFAGFSWYLGKGYLVRDTHAALTKWGQRLCLGHDHCIHIL